MTTDEAMQAVKKAVEEWVPKFKRALDDRAEEPRAQTGSIFMSDEEMKNLLAALRAIAPGGPLVVVPREHIKQLADRDCGAHCAMTLVHEQRHSDFCNKTRAMITEGEKP